MISFEDFKKLDLRVARITEAERVPDTDKLLKLKVDLGGADRQIVAGIAGDYAPEELVGKEIVIVANLEPCRFRGVESQGMLLAATSDGKISLLRPDNEIPPGTPIQ